MAHLHPAGAFAPDQELRRVATDDATLPVGSLAATEGPEATQVPEMPTAQIDGYDYIGTLTIPALELELPVMASGITTG